MDEMKIFLGKILGEIYRLQNGNGVANGVGEAHVYGLLHGFEMSIDEELGRIGFISDAKFEAAADVLDEIYIDKDKLAKFKGFYDIENALKEKGVDRSEAIKIFKFFLANDQFVELIAKMNTSGSPIECKTFELDRCDK